MNKHIFTTGCVLLQICLLLASAASGRTIYVDDDANVPGDGSSWATAFTWLQHALVAAEAGDEIRVAHGFYRPDQGLPRPTRGHQSGATTAALGGSGSPQATFSLKNGVALMGGFAGFDALNVSLTDRHRALRPGAYSRVFVLDPNVRNVEWYPTVLTGDLGTNDVDLWGPGSPLYEFLRADNSLRVVTSTEADATAVLDGFIIESAVDCGLYNQGGSPQIANCVFRKDVGQNLGGSAIRCEGGQPTLLNCVFQDNSAIHHQGGAIFVSGAYLTFRRQLGPGGRWSDLRRGQ